MERIQVDDGGPCETALAGLPFDGASRSRPGARHGPDAFRLALGRFTADPDETRWPAGARIIDLGDVDLGGQTAPAAHERVCLALEGILDRVVTLIAVGGDHSLSFPVFRALALARGGSWGIIALDAHHDVRRAGPEDIPRDSSLRRILDLGNDVILPERTVQIGIRPFANSALHRAWCQDRGIVIVEAAELRRRGPAAMADEALRAVQGADHLYLSIDLDALDQAEAPGTGAAGLEGLSLLEALALVSRIGAARTLRGVDIMELAPRWDPDGRTARAAARLFLEAVRARWPAPAGFA